MAETPLWPRLPLQRKMREKRIRAAVTKRRGKGKILSSYLLPQLRRRVVVFVCLFGGNFLNERERKREGREKQSAHACHTFFILSPDRLMEKKLSPSNFASTRTPFLPFLNPQR